MKSGFELDKLVAEKVFNHKIIATSYGKNRPCYTIGKPVWYDFSGDMQLQNYIPSYSENITDAWLIKEYLDEHYQALQFCLDQDYEGLWACTISEGSILGTSNNCDTAPQAICLAALNIKEKI